MGRKTKTEEDCVLRWAAGKGYLDIVKSLAEKGADMHSCEFKNDDEFEFYEGENALQCAVENGQLEVVKYLVENGADVTTVKNTFNYDPYDDYEDKDDCDNIDSSLQKALQNHYFAVVDFLIEKGLDINTNINDRLLTFVRKRNIEAVKYLIRQGADIQNYVDIALSQAVGHSKSIKMVKYLVEELDADVHSVKDWAIRMAIDEMIGSEAIVEYLISKGCQDKIEEVRRQTQDTEKPKLFEKLFRK